MASEVKVKVGLESGALASGLTKVRAQFSEFRAGLNSSFGSLIAIGVIEQGLQRLVEKGSLITDLADRFGISTEALQRFGNVAEQDGSSLEGVAKALNKLTISRENAQRGLKETTDSFTSLGISLQQVKDSTPDQLFLLIADATKNASDQGTAYANVVKLMGRSAGDLFITLQRGSAEINQVGGSIGVLADETVRNLDQIGDELAVFKNRILVFGGALLTFFAKITGSIGESFGTALNTAERSIETLGKALKLASRGQFIEAGKSFFEGTKGNLDATLREVAQVRKSVGDAFKDVGKEAFGVGTGSGRKSNAPVARRSVPEDRETDAEKSKLEKLQNLREKLADIQRTAANEQLDAEAKINALIAQRAALLKSAAGEKDAEKKLEIEIKAAELGKEIFSDQKAFDASIDQKKNQAPSVAADSLARIGGGGRAAVTGADPLLREQKIQSEILKQIAKNTQAQDAIALKLK